MGAGPIRPDSRTGCQVGMAGPGVFSIAGARALNSLWVFYCLAGAMAALVTALLLPFVWRGKRSGAAAAGWRNGISATALVLAVPALAFGLYGLLGDPGAVGVERSALSELVLQGGVDAESRAWPQVYAELERHLERQPADPRALVLKARLDMHAQRYGLAAATFEKAVAGKSKAANDPSVWVEYAEARGMAQGRTLAGAPLQLVHKALALDPNHFQALDLAGSGAWEMGEFGQSALYWSRLLEQIPANQPRHAELLQAIARAQQRSRLTLPAAGGASRP